MVSKGSRYPDHLNPFDEDDEKDEVQALGPEHDSSDDYPEHLDPFGANTPSFGPIVGVSVEDYDDSLNPFGTEGSEASNTIPDSGQACATSIENGENPFFENADQPCVPASQLVTVKEIFDDASTISTKESSEPPKPLPRTKSLLKKEQAHKKRLEEIKQCTSETENQINSLQSIASSTTSSSSTTTGLSENRHKSDATSSFKKKRNKRVAPPVPINFKRQVDGSLDDIEKELDDIGDKLSIIDKDSEVCQELLRSPDLVEDADKATTRAKFVELIKRRSSIVRRQKELMYKRRELKLDQLHADIEYELRMIGNKQVSARTPEDEARERDLLKKLVEIVEEKNDIVENLNKDTSCDSQDIDDAFKRLNIAELPTDEKGDGSKLCTNKIVPKSENCDKGSLAKLAKIATLLPKSNTIKLKHKRLFKKSCELKPIER